jgi:lipopolysaccharide assembly outer membrane protein LptD (OstA)
MKIKALILTVFALAFGVVFAGAFDVKNKEDKSGTFDFSKPGPLTVTAEKMLGSRNDESFSASGKVVAVSKPFTLLSELVVKEKDTYYFAPDTSLTSCSNDFDHLHWDISGEVTCKTSRYLLIKNAVLRLWDMPVMWMPYWYYPLETDYGLRVMPGYTGRWGTFLLTKYVYPIAGSFDDGAYGLSGSSRLDFR